MPEAGCTTAQRLNRRIVATEYAAPWRQNRRVTVTLRRPTPGEYQPWAALELEGYISEIVASGSLSCAAAEDQARREDAELLPQGLDTPGHLIFRLEADAQPVGWLWLARISRNIRAHEEGSVSPRPEARANYRVARRHLVPRHDSPGQRPDLAEADPGQRGRPRTELLVRHLRERRVGGVAELVQV